MKKNILFFENEQQVSDYLNRNSVAANNNILFIGLYPDAIAALEKKGLKYKYPEQYYNCKKEYKKLEIISNTIRKQLLTIGDELSHDFFPAFRHEQLLPFTFYEYFWQQLLDTILFKACQIKKILDYECPDTITMYSSVKAPIDLTLQFSANESIYNHCIEQVTKRKKIYFTYLDRKSNDNSNEFDTTTPEFRYNKKQVSLHRKLWLLKKKLKNLFRTKRNILINPAQNINCIKFKMVQYGYSLLELDRGHFLKIFNEYSDINNDSQDIIDKINKKVDFEYEDINISSLITPRIKYFVSKLNAFLQVYYKIRDFLQKRNIDIIFTDSLLITQFFANKYLHSAAVRLNIPVIGWLHGGVANYPIHFPKAWINYEMNYADKYFVYGDRIKDIIKNYAESIDNKFVSAGSQFIENNANNVKKHKYDNTIILALQGYHEKNRKYFGWENEAMKTPNYYYFFVRKIIENLTNIFSAKEIIIKPHPDDPDNIYDKYLSENVMIADKQKPFTDLLDNNVLVILNWLSTSFYEAAYSGNDIIVYTEFKTDYPEHTEFYNRAYICNTEKEFVGTLKKYKESGDYENKRNDKTFLENYLNIKEGIDNKKIILDSIAEIINN